MSTSLIRPATADRIFLWVMHRFAEEFEDHALLKGGMALRLFDSPRATTDIDYVFIPYASKKDIRGQIERVLLDLEGVDVHIEMHSKMLRAELRLDEASVQIEVSVALECDGLAISTGGFARAQGQPARVVRMMSPDWAFAHKLAAWNERRLLRDLYDCYFFLSRLEVWPDSKVLKSRLAKVASKLPALTKIKRMSVAQFASELRAACKTLTQARVVVELGGLLPEEELAGLALRIKASVIKTAEWVEQVG